MKIQDWKNEELGRLLREKWGLTEKEELEEAAKPDFLDLDKDGDKKEPMSAAAKEEEEETVDEGFGEGTPPKEEIYKKRVVELEEGAVGGTTYGAEHGSPEMEMISPEDIDTLQMLLSKVASMLENPLPDDPTAHTSPPRGAGPRDSDEALFEDGEAFAPNHYCVHHGGVQHEGKLKMAEAVSHNYDDELGRVTRYDMQLEDGTVLEVAAEDIQVTEATLAEGHPGHRTDDDKKKKKKPVIMKQEDKLRESIRAALLKLREQNKI